MFDRQRMFISFRGDVTTGQVAKALKKLRIEDEPIITICKEMIIQEEGGHFRIKPKPESMEDKIRRIIREEIGS